MNDSHIQTWLESLSPREIEILTLISEGLSNREIAQRLILSLETIKWYNKQIYRKLGVNSRTQAVNKAQEFGLFETGKSLGGDQTDALSNLPTPLTSFVGRVAEIAEIKHLLKSSRLVVLTGPGGSGKSRLALQVAAELIQFFRDGVWWVELSSLHDPVQVADLIAHVLDVSPRPEVSCGDVVKRYLARKHLLLVLDNFEHLLAAAPWVGELLGAAPQVTILATSRERLNVHGEQDYQVQPLKLPDLQKKETSEQLKGYDAVKLFVMRAQAVQPDFILNDAQAPVVALVCERLDGLPLAIELAAARIKLFTPQQMLERLGSRLGMLTGGSRDAPARQRTLRDTIDWSYNLLNEDEQHLFTQLGVFSGGFSLEAEVEICDPGPRYDPLDGLESLLNKSLIYKAEAPDGEARFFMLETIHEYARERLEESQEERLIRNRHLAFFLALAEKAKPHLHESEQVTWLDRLEIEHGNFRAALVWSQSTEDEAESGLRLAGSLGTFWGTRGYFNEGREYLSAALSQPEALERTSARARALHAAGLLAYMQSDYPDTNLLIEESLSIYRELGHAGGEDFANALITLGDMKTELGDYTGASSLMTEALGIMRELDDLPGILRALWQLGACAVRPGDLEGAIRYLEEALPLGRQIGDKTATGIVLTSLAEVAIRQGEYERATTFEEQSLEMRREVGEPWGIAVSLGNFAWIALLQGDLKQAVTLLGESLNLRHEIGDQGGMAWCLEKFAEIVFTQGHLKDPPQRLEDLQRAAQMFGSAQALRAPIGSVMDLVDQPKYAHWIDGMRAQLGEATFDAAWAEGQKMTVDQAVEYALSDLDRDNDSIE